MSSITWLFFALVALTVSYLKDAKRTEKALLISFRSFMSLVPNLLGRVGLIGIMLAMTPPQALTRLFSVHGIAGFFLTATVGAIVTISAPVA